MENIFELGKIVNTHGVRGELKVEPWCEASAVFPLVKAVSTDKAQYKIASFRPHKNLILLTLEGIDTMEKAIALKNTVIYVPRESINLPQDKFFYSDMYGFEVYDNRIKRVIGTLKEVLELPASDMYVIEHDGREILIPAVEEFEDGVDFDEKRIYLNTIEGLLPDEN